MEEMRQIHLTQRWPPILLGQDDILPAPRRPAPKVYRGSSAEQLDGLKQRRLSGVVRPNEEVDAPQVFDL